MNTTTAARTTSVEGLGTFHLEELGALKIIRRAGGEPVIAGDLEALSAWADCAILEDDRRVRLLCQLGLCK